MSKKSNSKAKQKPQNKRKNKGRPEPPKEYRWKPGQSGNPGGRPKRKVLSDAYRAALEQEVPGDKKGRTWAEFIADQMVMEAAKRKVPAAAELADRTEGKARQAFEVKSSLIDDLADIVKRARERAAIEADKE